MWKCELTKVEYSFVVIPDGLYVRTPATNVLRATQRYWDAFKAAEVESTAAYNQAFLLRLLGQSYNEMKEASASLEEDCMRAIVVVKSMADRQHEAALIAMAQRWALFREYWKQSRDQFSPRFRAEIDNIVQQIEVDLASK